jgi:5-formyltetrahydrofolate cyclo-ligase
MIDDPVAAKAAARKTAMARRAGAHGAVASAQGCVHLTAALLALRGVGRARIIAGYMPIRTEIDPIPAMTSLHEVGAALCVPVVMGAGLPLSFRAWTPGCALVLGPFGAAIPEDGETVTPDALIVPLVAFDDAGRRLGYGGGFYDRTLEALRATGSVDAVGFAYAAQRADALPFDATDQPLSAIVTEAGARAL